MRAEATCAHGPPPARGLPGRGMWVTAGCSRPEGRSPSPVGHAPRTARAWALLVAGPICWPLRGLSTDLVLKGEDVIEIAAGSPPRDVDPLGGTPYRALRRIGAGAMGEVFEAEHGALGRRVAVKVLSPALAGDPVFVDRLRLEAQALASVRHPNVVLVHDHAATPAGVPFLVMELLRGRTLHAVLRERGAIPLLEGLCLVDQVFAGLMAIHGAGLAHRDLKPANIFLASEGGRTTVKLLDFGIVKVTRASASPGIAPLRFPTELGHILGTPRFMAPEQVLSGACDTRSDIYAAGVLLFMLLSGRDPFHHHHTTVAILTAHARETPPLLSAVASQAIPAGVDAAVARALAKAPEDRFASIADFGAALVAAISGRGVRPAAGGPAGTERMPGGTWSRPPQATAPLDAGAFRAIRGVLPFVPREAGEAAAGPSAARQLQPVEVAAQGGLPRRAPSFGLPAPVAVSAGAPAEAAAPAQAAARGLAVSAGSSMEDNRLLFVAVALLWVLLAAVAWKVL